MGKGEFFLLEVVPLRQYPRVFLGQLLLLIDKLLNLFFQLVEPFLFFPFELGGVGGGLHLPPQVLDLG